MVRSSTHSWPSVDRHRQRARLADEAVDEGRVRRVVDLVGGADLLDPALAHDDDAVGEFQRLFLVVGDEDGGVAGGVVDFAQPAAQLAADLRVERAERLVEQEHRGSIAMRAGERHALALAAGELRRIALLQAGELHEVEEFRGAAADLGLGGPRRAGPDLQAEADILDDRHVLEQRVVLEHEADIALLHGLLRGVLVAEEDGAAVGRSSPAIRRSSVVLPEPDGPRSAISSPDLMSSETSCSAGKRSNSLRTLATRTSIHMRSPSVSVRAWRRFPSP